MIKKQLKIAYIYAVKIYWICLNILKNVLFSRFFFFFGSRSWTNLYIWKSIILSTKIFFIFIYFFLDISSCSWLLKVLNLSLIKLNDTIRLLKNSIDIKCVSLPSVVFLLTFFVPIKIVNIVFAFWTTSILFCNFRHFFKYRFP